MRLWGGLLKLGYRLWWHRIGPLALGYWPLFIGVLWLGIPWLAEANLVATWPYALALSAVTSLFTLDHLPPTKRSLSR